uniref:(northern house mosquito) hypothetical protein n=1 Tax=Culex pipiens TaxID=7175 RepID=A0A8D8F3W3_CULPI
MQCFCFLNFYPAFTTVNENVVIILLMWFCCCCIMCLIVTNIAQISTDPKNRSYLAQGRAEYGAFKKRSRFFVVCVCLFTQTIRKDVQFSQIFVEKTDAHNTNVCFKAIVFEWRGGQEVKGFTGWWLHIYLGYIFI